MTEKDALTIVDSPPTERLPDESDGFELGQWYWFNNDFEETKKKDRHGDRLACITEIGSNYVEVTAVSKYNSTWRIHINEFDKYCKPAPTAKLHIEAKTQEHRENVATLLDRVKQLTARLGVAPRDALASESETANTALAVAHGTADVEAHKKALIKAKEKTLPELFKQIEAEHEAMAMWMKAELMPKKAELELLKGSIEVIENRIFTVELYAGLTEKLALIQDGAPADNDTKVSLFQRRHYMDEECLLDYQSGGMDFRKIEDFDAWLLKKENLNRILPLDRCVVAFRIRRDMKYRHGTSLSDWIRIMNEEKADKQTFLYIRNGQKVYRMSTAIDFGEQLFPDKDRSTLLGGGNIYIDRRSSEHKVISQRQYDVWAADKKKQWDEYYEKKKRYDAMTPEEKKNSFHTIGHLWEPHVWEEYELCTPDSVYYDDAMKQVAKAAMEHNRIAVVLQGLLDRSPAFHPHPPWLLWKPEGFASGIELIYDDSLAITSGDVPDFEEYRRQLAKSIKRGSMVIGQERLWMAAMAEKEDIKRGRRSGRSYDGEYYRPYGNPGPGFIAEVKRIGRDGSVTFEWERERSTIKWVRDPKNPGYMMADESGINTSFACKAESLFNVSAYTPGDYKMFFSDPRARAKYLEWAPFMLAAEDYHATGKVPKVGYYR